MTRTATTGSALPLEGFPTSPDDVLEPFLKCTFGYLNHNTRGRLVGPYWLRRLGSERLVFVGQNEAIPYEAVNGFGLKAP